MAMRFSKWLEYRPTECRMCGAALTVKKTGRPRFTCSDKCRQRMRRLDWTTWGKPRQERRTLRRAEREVKRIEKALGGEGSLDVPTPGYEWLTLRKRVLIRLERGEEIPFCKVCWRPYIMDGRSRKTCSERCTAILGERERAVQEAVGKWAGQYDPRVDVRLRLGLAIKVCGHCGRPFPDYYPRQVYCSERCRKNAWYARHPRRHCVVCGKEFRRPSRTCSAKCAKRYVYHHAPHCARCATRIEVGQEILPNEHTRLPKRRKNSRWDHMAVVFCSAQCRDALGWSPSYKICVGCREVYWPTAKNAQRRQQYCTENCRRRTKDRAERRRLHAERPPRKCRWCGADVPKGEFRDGGQPWYCTDDCHKAAASARRRALRRLRAAA